MTSLGEKPNVGIIVDILPGTDGKIKMSKSLGNNIPLLSSPQDMYGKVMSIPDEAVGAYMRLVTRCRPDQISLMEHEVEEGEFHIRDLKMRLANEIVSVYHSPTQAKEAQYHFIKVFQKKDTPDDMPEYKLVNKMNLLDFMADRNLCSSKSEARRLIKQKAVRFDGKLVEGPDFLLEDPGVLKVGKRKFIRLI